MKTLPIPTLVDLYDVRLFKPTNASKILDLTGKTARVSADRAAIAINTAIRDCLARIGPAIASPPSEQAKWAEQLTRASTQALALLAPNTSTTTLALLGGDLNAAYSRLFDCGGPPKMPASLLKRFGFDSPGQALELGVMGLWFIRAFAVHSRNEWRKRRRRHSDRRTADPVLLLWVQAMGELYADLLAAQPPHEPTASSPFIRFCEEVRAIMLSRASATSDDITMPAFLAALRRAEPGRLAEFIRRNKKRLSWGAAASPKE